MAIMARYQLYLLGLKWFKLIILPKSKHLLTQFLLMAKTMQLILVIMQKELKWIIPWGQLVAQEQIQITGKDNCNLDWNLVWFLTAGVARVALVEIPPKTFSTASIKTSK